MSTSTKNQHSYSFLQGGGEMGEMIRSNDWSKTPVGDVSEWPQSLRTTLGIIIKSKFPMFLWWGPELICFYNDAYRPSLGNNGKHPSILGMPAKEAWPEIWDIIKPLIDQVLAGGEATWSEDQLVPIFRNGKIEDVYWTFSYSPVNNESNSIAGVLVTCNETTEKVNTQRKLKESKEQLEFAIEAAKLGTWDYNPSTNKFIANNRLREWFGLSADAEIELADAINVIADQDKQRTIDAIKSALNHSSGGSYDIEYSIINPVTKKTVIVQAKGKAWFNEEKAAYRFNGTVEDVTEKVITRNRAEQNEHRFRNILKQAPMGITILNGHDFMVEMANENYLRLIDRKERDFVGKSLFDSLPEVTEAVKPLLKEVLTTGVPYYGYEFPVTIHRYGKEEQTYFNFVYYPMKEEEGGVISRIIVVATDVTPSVLAKNSLAESELRLRSFVESAPFPIGVYIGREMLIQLANQSILDVWGKGKDVVGKKYADVLPELKGQGIYEQLDSVYTTGIAFHAHNQRVDLMIHDKLTPHYFNYSFTPLFDMAGRIYGVMNTAAEVTDLVTTKQKIEESEKKFRMLADSMPQHIWTSDTKGNFNYFNQSVFTYSGLTQEHFEKDGWMQIVHPEDREENILTWMHSIISGEPFLFEHRFKRNDGQYRWQLSRALPVKDSEGKIQMWVGTSTDIDEIKKHQQEKDDFIKIASHELKTPVTTIKAYVQLLLNQRIGTQDVMMTKSLSTIDKQITKLAKLISDLMDVTKIELGSFRANKEHFSITELTRDMANNIQATTSTHQVILNQSNDIIVNADKDRITQVVTNLLINAIKYSPNADKVIIDITTQSNEVIV